MAVAKVTACPGNEQMAELREFLFAGQWYQTFNLQVTLNIVDRERNTKRNQNQPEICLSEADVVEVRFHTRRI